MKVMLLASTIALAPLWAVHAQEQEPAAGGTSGAQEQPSTGNASAASPEMQQAMTDAAAFVQTASASNQWEIQSSELALERSQDQAVQDFARQMVEDHGAVADQLKAVLEESDDEALPDAESLGLDAKHEEMLTQLQEASDDEFDQMYLQMQLQAHQDAVALFEGFAANGNDQALQDFAQDTLPTLQDHFLMVEEIAGSAG